MTEIVFECDVLISPGSSGFLVFLKDIVDLVPRPKNCMVSIGDCRIGLDSSRAAFTVFIVPRLFAGLTGLAHTFRVGLSGTHRS